MSKDADKDVVESAGSQRARRRRKKSGLRIPSDNVPRSAPTPAAGDSDVALAQADDQDGPGEAAQEGVRNDGVVTPVPPDSDRAVSVPYSFAADEARAGSESDDASGPAPAEGAAGVAGETHTSGTSDHSRPTTEPADSPPGGVAAEASGGAAAGDEAESEDDLETRKTRRMPAVQLQDLGLTEDLLGGDSEDSIDIPIDEGEPEEADDDEDAGSLRAATVALSDEDLEELIEDSGKHRAADPGASQRGASAPSGPSSDDALDVRATQPVPLLKQQPGPQSGQVGATSGEPAGKRSATSPPQGHKKPQTPPEPGVPAAVAALEGAGMESPGDGPFTLNDAGDSGEMLSEELIEEVDDSDVEVDDEAEVRASPPPAPPAASSAKKPPPAPSRSGSKPRAATPAPKRRKGKPWFEEIFDEDYLRTLPFLTPQATQAEAAFVAGALDVEPGSQLLDIGCGYGRHAMELAARGYQVIALDLSLPLLLRGADEAQRRGLNINFVHGDMRELNFDSQFDGAYCLFSTFGYFDDEANKKTAQGIARALKPGARLVIEILNRDYLIADLPARVWWEGDGCVVLEEVDFNYFASRIASNRSVVFDDGRQLEQEISMRAYSLHEFGKLLHNVGFRVVEISGSMATRGRFFGNKSREIIVIAEKRPDGREATQPGVFARPTSDQG